MRNMANGWGSMLVLAFDKRIDICAKVGLGFHFRTITKKLRRYVGLSVVWGPQFGKVWLEDH